MARRFQDLILWKDSFEFAKTAYGITSNFPKDELYSLTSQLRRAALSISNNIAEGCGRETRKDFVRFLYISSGSIKECQNLLLFSKELGYLSNTDFIRLFGELDRLGGMLFQFIKNVRY